MVALFLSVLFKYLAVLSLKVAQQIYQTLVLVHHVFVPQIRFKTELADYSSCYSWLASLTLSCISCLDEKFFSVPVILLLATWPLQAHTEPTAMALSSCVTALSQVRCSFCGVAQTLAEFIETIISLHVADLVHYVSV